MKFQKLAQYFQRLEKTASRNQMTEILAELFQKAKKEEIDKICYLSLGKLGPKFSTIQFALADKMIIKAISQAFQIEEDKTKQDFKKKGDLGNVVAGLQKKETSNLSIIDTYQKLYQIASESGEGSVERKLRKTAALLKELDCLSVKYVVRIPLAKLRLGFSDMTILDALSWMIKGDKSKRKEIEAAYQIRADVGQIAKLVKTKGLAGLKGMKVQLGTPLIPALCQRLPNAEEMIKKMGQVAVEAKYDGSRLQIHYGKNTSIFTRNLDNVTHMFPDLVKAIKTEVKGNSFILDGEVVGIDSRTGKLLPFQETIKRKRKHQVQMMIETIPLRFFCFDVLFYNGKDLLNIPFKKRRQLLEKILSKNNKTIKITPQMITDDPQVVRKYHHQMIKEGLEGAVLKKLNSHYDPGRRGYTWVKLKSEKKGKRGGNLTDTIDGVIMGYYLGQGKRTSFGIGAFLVGIRSKGKFLTVCKIGTGLSDQQWQETRRRCEKVKVDKKPNQYQLDKKLVPDVWCQPEIVVEIEADNITKSPVHSAGYALRFPRLLRFRDDKDVQQATDLPELKKLYKIQLS